MATALAAGRQTASREATAVVVRILEKIFKERRGYSERDLIISSPGRACTGWEN